MESAYAIRGGEKSVSAFLRKLYNTWLLDLQDTGRYYDMVIRCARADRPFSLYAAQESALISECPLEEGDCFFTVFCTEEFGETVSAAAEAYREGLEGPFTVPSSGSFTIYNTVTFRR